MAQTTPRYLSQRERTCKERGDRVRGGLQGRAQGEDDHGSQDGALAADPVRDGPVDQRPEPGEQQQRRHEPALEAAVEVDARELGGERLHGQDARDDALVIAEEEAPQGRELCQTEESARRRQRARGCDGVRLPRRGRGRMGSAAAGAPSPCWARRKGLSQLPAEPWCLVGFPVDFLTNCQVKKSKRVEQPRS